MARRNRPSPHPTPSTSSSRRSHLDPEASHSPGSVCGGLADPADRLHAGATPEDHPRARPRKQSRTALELDPNLAEAWASSALIRTFRGQYDRADPLYRRSIALNPNNAAAYQRFSPNAGGLGHRDEAVAAAQKAVALDPLSAIVNADVGRALMSVGRFDEAADRFRRANEIDPEMPMPYRQLGVLGAYVRNRFAGAVPLLQRAAALDPANPILEFHLARLYLDLGDDLEATRVIEVARDRWPTMAPC